MSIVNPGDEQYFECVGKEKEDVVEEDYYLGDLTKLGLVEVCNVEEKDE